MVGGTSAPPAWEVTGGSIDSGTGLFTAPDSPGSVTISATVLDQGRSASNTIEITVRTPLTVSGNPNAYDSRTGRTPLHIAAMANAPKLIAALVAAGADLEARNADGRPWSAQTEPVHDPRIVAGPGNSESGLWEIEYVFELPVNWVETGHGVHAHELGHNFGSSGTGALSSSAQAAPTVAYAPPPPSTDGEYAFTLWDAFQREIYREPMGLLTTAHGEVSRSWAVRVPVPEQTPAFLAILDARGTPVFIEPIADDFEARVGMPLETIPVEGNALHAEVLALWNAEADPDEFYHGVFHRPRRASGDRERIDGGRASRPGYVAFSQIGLHNVIPHEFGHNLSLFHAAGVEVLRDALPAME